jgi:hypothetical protein
MNATRFVHPSCLLERTAGTLLTDHVWHPHRLSAELRDGSMWFTALRQAMSGHVNSGEDDWEPAWRFFEERRTDLDSAGEWRRCGEDLDDENGVSLSSLVSCFCTRIDRVLTFRIF